MGGSKPKGPEKVEPTEAEVAAGEVAAAMWNDHMQNGGRELASEFIASQTGMTVDPETGEMSIVKGGKLNEDGSTRTDISASITANEAAFTKAGMENTDPNRIGMTNDIYEESARSGVEGQLKQKLSQQTGVLEGIQNVAAYGQGGQIDAAESQLGLANQANQEAINDAFAAQQDQQSTMAGIGTLAGIGTAAMSARGGGKRTMGGSDTGGS